MMYALGPTWQISGIAGVIIVAHYDLMENSDSLFKAFLA